METFEDFIIKKADEIYDEFFYEYGEGVADEERIEIAETMKKTWENRSREET